jgi:hypothetical protein
MRVAEVALILKAGREVLAGEGVEFKREDSWFEVKQTAETDGAEE